MFAILAILTSCHNTKSKRKARTPHKGKFFSLEYCINTTLEHRTEYDIYMRKKRIADENLTAKTLKKLHNLAKHYNSFNDNNASLNTGQINTTRIEQIIDILNFSMAYLNAWQKEDRRLITVEEKQTAEQNLKFAVTEIYFKMALFQYIIETTEKMIVKRKEIEKYLTKLYEERKVPPLRILNERKCIIRLEKSLMRYRLNYQGACRELRTMMGLVKNKEVDIKCLETISVPSLPKIATLEKIALLERPGFKSLDIVINDVRKTVIRILPKHKMYDNPRMFYFSYWQEIGICAAYASLKLPPELSKYLTKISLMETESIRKLALAIGITALVRMSHANIMKAKERYEFAEKTYKAYKNHLDISIKNKYLSQMEQERLELDTYECSINRMVSMCDYHIAYCRLLNVLGVASLDPAAVKILKNKIKLLEEKEKTKPLSKTIIQIYLKTVNKLKSEINQDITKSR